MIKFRYAAAAASLALVLAACGETQDASDDAMADTVEIPADEAMANAPLPADDADAVTDAADGVAPETAEQTAQQAADDAQAAVDDAVTAAEATTDAATDGN